MRDLFAELVTEGATKLQLDGLLALASDRDTQSSFLSTILSDRSALANHLTDLFRDTPQSGHDWLSVVSDDRTPPATLRRVREFAKASINKASDEGERVAATLLYHAAVAAAWARHGENISTRSLENRVPLYEDLADIMIADPLGTIFRQAADRLASTEFSGNGKEMA